MQKVLTEERREFLRMIARRGGRTRAKQFTSKYQRSVRARVSHAACVANGRKGGIASAAARRTAHKVETPAASVRRAIAPTHSDQWVVLQEAEPCLKSIP